MINDTNRNLDDKFRIDIGAGVVWQTKVLNAFVSMKMIEFWFEFPYSLFPGVQLTINQQVQVMAWRLRGDTPLPEPKLT